MDSCYITIMQLVLSSKVYHKHPSILIHKNSPPSFHWLHSIPTYYNSFILPYCYVFRMSPITCNYRWLNDKESICQCRKHKRLRFNFLDGMTPWSRKWQPTLVFLPEKPHEQRSLVDYIHGATRVRHDWAHTHSQIIQWWIFFNMRIAKLLFKTASTSFRSLSYAHTVKKTLAITLTAFIIRKKASPYYFNFHFLNH